MCVFEEYLEKIIDEGLEKGMQQGIEQGKKESIYSIVIEMIKNNIDESKIKLITKISEKEFRSIKKNMIKNNL